MRISQNCITCVAPVHAGAKNTKPYRRIVATHPQQRFQNMCTRFPPTGLCARGRPALRPAALT
jgi:hypothetical protein